MLEIRYDDIIDDVAEKFSELVKISKEQVHFVANGKECSEYEMVAELGVIQDKVIYVEIKDAEY